MRQASASKNTTSKPRTLNSSSFMLPETLTQATDLAADTLVMEQWLRSCSTPHHTSALLWWGSLRPPPSAFALDSQPLPYPKRSRLTCQGKSSTDEAQARGSSVWQKVKDRYSVSHRGKQNSSEAVLAMSGTPLS